MRSETCRGGQGFVAACLSNCLVVSIIWVRHGGRSCAPRPAICIKGRLSPRVPGVRRSGVGYQDAPFFACPVRGRPGRRPQAAVGLHQAMAMPPAWRCAEAAPWGAQASGGAPSCRPSCVNRSICRTTGDTSPGSGADVAVPGASPATAASGWRPHRILPLQRPLLQGMDQARALRVRVVGALPCLYAELLACWIVAIRRSARRRRPHIAGSVGVNPRLGKARPCRGPGDRGKAGHAGGRRVSQWSDPGCQEMHP